MEKIANFLSKKYGENELRKKCLDWMEKNKVDDLDWYDGFTAWNCWEIPEALEIYPMPLIQFLEDYSENFLREKAIEWLNNHKDDSSRWYDSYMAWTCREISEAIQEWILPIGDIFKNKKSLRKRLKKKQTRKKMYRKF